MGRVNDNAACTPCLPAAHSSTECSVRNEERERVGRSKLDREIEPFEFRNSLNFEKSETLSSKNSEDYIK